MSDENDLISQPETEVAPEPDAPAEAALPDDEPEATAPADTSAESPAAEQYTADLDVDAALAAVASLSDLIAEQEAAEQARLDAEAQAAEQAAQQAAPIHHPVMPRPPMLTLRRGQPASVVPAALLIGVGAWLTFALTASPTPPDSIVIASVAAAGLALALMSHWLSSGRWSRGVFFFVALLILNAAALVFLIQPVSPGLTRGWPLFLVTSGIGFVLTAFLTRPQQRRLALPGILLIVSGLVGLSIGLAVTDSQILAAIAPFWPAALAAVLLVWLLPVIFRRHGRDRRG